MSVLSDVKELYGALETTWTSSRAHLITHAAFLLIVFWLLGASIPQISFPEPNAKAIGENDWFKLAKDTGFVYIILIIPIAALSAYGAVLRQMGQIFLSITSLIVLSRRPLSPFTGLNEYDLEPLALLAKKDEFQLHDLQERVGPLTAKFLAAKSDLTASYQKAITAITRNSVQYFGDFSVFLGFWLALFWLLPHSAWTETNRIKFWPVVLILLCVIILSWMRVSRALLALPRLQLQMLAAMVRIDPEFSALLEASENRRNQVRERLAKLLEEERARQNRMASMSKLIIAGFASKSSGKTNEGVNGVRGWPCADLFEQGQRLAWDVDSIQQFRGGTIKAIAAHLYYSFYERLERLCRVAWQLIRYVIVGVP